MGAAGAATVQTSLRIPRNKTERINPRKGSRGAAFPGAGAELEQGDSSGQQEAQAQPWFPAASAGPAVRPAGITGL